MYRYKMHSNLCLNLSDNTNVSQKVAVDQQSLFASFWLTLEHAAV